MNRFAVGELMLRSHYADGQITGIEIIRADEYALISKPLLDQIRKLPGPGVHLDETTQPARLTIHGTNRDVTYELGPDDDEQPSSRQMTRTELG